jgi:hypothetical protein
MRYQLGKWYEAKRQVRATYGEYWKGILLHKDSVAVIFNFTGARRIHYGDLFDPGSGTIRYVGEGKTGDQTLNPRNKRLHAMAGSTAVVDLFLDCGDLFSPKKLLYAGKWTVVNSQFKSIGRRKVYLFGLKAHSASVIEFLRFTFFDTERTEFERSLKRFSKARHALYKDFPEVLRSRDNIAGEIGEYFAIKALNRSETNSVIRLSSGIKDIDAIQTRNGTTYAIKTIGKIPQTTSNIWAKDPASAVDYFVIVLLSHEELTPTCILKLRSRNAAQFLKMDKYQGAWKLLINENFLKRAKLLHGKLPDSAAGRTLGSKSGKITTGRIGRT